MYHTGKVACFFFLTMNNVIIKIKIPTPMTQNKEIIAVVLMITVDCAAPVKVEIRNHYY